MRPAKPSLLRNGAGRHFNVDPKVKAEILTKFGLSVEPQDVFGTAFGSEQVSGVLTQTWGGSLLWCYPRTIFWRQP